MTWIGFAPVDFRIPDALVIVTGEGKIKPADTRKHGEEPH
jgi:hypothetical protein